jgi:hypothetical protein
LVPKRGRAVKSVSFPGAYNDNDAGSYDPKHIRPRRCLHFPVPLICKPKFELRADMTAAANCRVVVAMRNLIIIIHPAVHE